MFGKGIRLFSLAGFEVRLDPSWLVIAVLATWSLAAGFFPRQIEGLSQTAYWIMGVVGALGLFASIVLHEFGHSVVARRYGMPMKGITLFIFGGIAEMGDEPPGPKAEFWVAVAGPIVSALIAISGWALHVSSQAAGFPAPVHGVVYYIAIINTALVLFNMVPAFPLDGGRVLRSFLWARRGSLRQASSTTSRIGAGFGLGLIALGVVNFIAGSFVGGIWYVLLGLFLRGAANQGYQQVVLRDALSGSSIRRFTNDQPVTVSPDTSVQKLIDDYVLRYHHKMFPVTRNGHLLGAVRLDQVKDIPPDERDRHTVEEIVTPPDEANSIDADADAVQALAAMHKARGSRMMVVKADKLEGILSLKDLQEFLALKLELER
jgi:Zn-dependent protease